MRTALEAMAAALEAAIELEEVSRLLLLLGDRPLQLLPDGEPERLAARYDSVWTVPSS